MNFVDGEAADDKTSVCFLFSEPPPRPQYRRKSGKLHFHHHLSVFGACIYQEIGMGIFL